MTHGQKEQIDTLREQGNGYKRIAGILGVSVNTIASYCRRKTAVCPCCGATLVMTPKHRKKKFCSDTCRLKWWYANSEKLNKKANYDCTCQFCGKVFVSYGNKNRKYCSRSCYGKSRRSLGQDHAVQGSGANFENASC